MKPIMVRKKKNTFKNSLILFIFLVVISACCCKIYMIYEQCLRLYFITGHMKKKALTFLKQTPSPQEIHVLQEKIKEALKQKRTYTKKRDNAYLLIDWYLYLYKYIQNITIKQAILNKKSIKLSVEAAQESAIELFSQYMLQNKIFAKTQLRSCEKTTINKILCEINIPINE